jgi:hypothetical protein
VGGPLPQRPDIPANSKATLDAIQRTQYVLGWINELLAGAEKRNINVDTERKEVVGIKASLEGVKVAWHTFNLEGVLDMANKTYLEAVDLKGRLSKKVDKS